MKRKSFLIKGYDCRERCTDPRHTKTFGKTYERPGLSHGQHCDEWRYTLTDSEAAVVLTVLSKEASTHSRNLVDWLGPPEGAHLTFHYPWRESDEDVREKRDPGQCDVLPGGRCFGGSSYLYAEEFFKLHGAPQFEQPERFWVAFEKYAAETIAESKKNAAEFRVKRCPTCDAKGVVPK